MTAKTLLEKTGNRFVLQVGGVQDAVMPAPPVLVVLTVPARTGATALLDVSQVKAPAGRGMVLPRESVTVALRATDVPLATCAEVLPEFTSLSEMVWTGQVLKLND